jgi:hypothetical protein
MATTIDTATVENIGPDVMGHERYSVTVDGRQLGIVRRIKLEDMQHFSRHMIASARWAASGGGGHHKTLKDAVTNMIRWTF